MMNEDDKKEEMAEVVVGDEEAPAAKNDTPPASAVPPSGGTKMGVGTYQVSVSDVQLPMVLMFAASIVLLIAVTSWKFGIKWREYAISVPAVTMGFSFIGIIMAMKEDFYTKFGKFLNQFLFVWNFVGACFLTFSSPFVTTGNGYFAAWATVVASAMALGFTASAFKSSVKGLGALMGLLASSIIVIVALIEYVGIKDSPVRAESIYAMCLACVTLVLIIVHIWKEKKEGDGDAGGMVMFGIFLSFAIMWVVAACLVTFRGPFLTTGNGYFASWAGAATSCMAAFAARKHAGAGGDA